jgi:hypothetical protein
MTEQQRLTANKPKRADYKSLAHLIVRLTPDLFAAR